MDDQVFSGKGKREKNLKRKQGCLKKLYIMCAGDGFDGSMW